MPGQGDAVETQEPTVEETGITVPPARPALARLEQVYDELRAEAARVVVSQEGAFRQMVVALFTGGHVLHAGVPGTAKTLALPLGASPHASVALLLASKTLATLKGRDFVRPDDMRVLTPPALRHRIVLRAEAESALAHVPARAPVPR
jgi:MoxR-like ATPase